jgi:hypothetical protein
MLIYFALLLVPFIAAMVHPPVPRGSYTGLWIYFVVLLVFCGLRIEVGPDWTGYLEIYDIATQLDYEDLLDKPEAVFFLLNRVSDEMGLGYSGVIFACSLIFLIGCFKYARCTSNPWLAMCVVTPYLIFIISMSGIRQASAIGISMLMLARWEQSSRFEKLACIALATSVHNSAAILLVFFILDFRSHLTARLALTLIVTGTILYFSRGAETVERYRTAYVEENLISGGAFFHILLTAFPAALYLIFRRNLAAAGMTNKNVLTACVLSLAAVPLLPISSTGVDRLALYFSFVQMWTYPALLRAGVVNINSGKAFIGAVVMAIFFVYFLFGTHADSYLPYRNLIF